MQFTPLWLIRNAEELPQRNATRSPILKVDNSVKIILVRAAGQASELNIFSQLALRLHEDFPECAVRILLNPVKIAKKQSASA
ncbi:hypothetical protein [Nodularia sphaerocarpa]|uniref:hypothetical protein n=1 Tax=Nodularia sphaerocarpa TaxID=137816 RepID=UPI001EFB71E3|nr:hypothetical protein [Nodularia sphaerocarpa]MDB9372978.1 hypothetical protein [Nodularia sphaerocarpa CS-585]MDB9378321.1 hypothetical protein [Nodularia sphaerocarpa CS-585A2]ULP71618.1 hypothetical protein BDGGKGIB_01249 [Nodularia sphaerocarpa UHCC 0038]